jgi:hypothetical protein
MDAGAQLLGESTSGEKSRNSGGYPEVAACAEDGVSGVEFELGGLVSYSFQAATAAEKGWATSESFGFPPFRQKAPEGWATWMLSWAQVAERLMAADCKSAAPCELRRFESSPVHQKNRE